MTTYFKSITTVRTVAIHNITTPHLKSIVAVHNTVHEVVHAHEPTGGRDVVRVRVPCVQEHGHVVVPVIRYLLVPFIIEKH